METTAGYVMYYSLYNVKSRLGSFLFLYLQQTSYHDCYGHCIKEYAGWHTGF